MIPFNRRGEKLEPFARDRHQFRDTSQIPIGIGDLSVADVGRERCHCVVDIGAVLLPELDTATNKGVASHPDRRAIHQVQVGGISLVTADA